MLTIESLPEQVSYPPNLLGSVNLLQIAIMYIMCCVIRVSELDHLECPLSYLNSGS